MTKRKTTTTKKTTSLPDTVFLRGKVIILYKEAKKAATGTLAVVKQ